MAAGSAPAAPAEGAAKSARSALTAPLADVLRVFSQLRGEMLRVLPPAEVRDIQPDSIDSILALRAAGVGTGATEVEKELELEVRNLLRQRDDLGALFTACSEQQQAFHMPYDDELKALDDKIAQLRRVHDPRSGREVEVAALHVDSLAHDVLSSVTLHDDSPAPALVEMLCQAVCNLDQAQRVVNQRAGVAEQVHLRELERVRDELFVLKRQLLSKNEILELYKAHGFDIGCSRTVEERSLEALDEFNQAKARLRGLEQELAAKGEVERRLTDNIEAISREKKQIAFDRIAVQRRLEECKEELQQCNQRLREAVTETEQLQGTVKQAHQILCGCYPAASHLATMGVADVAAAHAEALGSLRGLINEICHSEGELRPDLRGRFAQGHALHAEVVQLSEWARRAVAARSPVAPDTQQRGAKSEAAPVHSTSQRRAKKSTVQQGRPGVVSQLAMGGAEDRRQSKVSAASGARRAEEDERESPPRSPSAGHSELRQQWSSAGKDFT
eukprot:TRINITY_DN12790_c0_g1_i1.p1 TRINITY_DN12790_c0_g1~~TRINITY_DN12790_c0_g1_i1.p1  ORF type:complete len:529 (+),score=178.53 TRINITY_DN12790_c0_g1_i1:81-1589(+)